jgi:hypothetical protein
MRLYYFDLREGDDLAPHEEGLELPGIEGMQEEAARALADMARDAFRKNHDGPRHRMAIEVRDGNGPVLQARFTFEIDRHQHQVSTSARPSVNVTTRLEHRSHRGRRRLDWILPV